MAPFRWRPISIIHQPKRLCRQVQLQCGHCDPGPTIGQHPWTPTSLGRLRSEHQRGPHLRQTAVSFEPAPVTFFTPVRSRWIQAMNDIRTMYNSFGHRAHGSPMNSKQSRWLQARYDYRGQTFVTSYLVLWIVLWILTILLSCDVYSLLLTWFDKMSTDDIL